MTAPHITITARRQLRKGRELWEAVVLADGRLRELRGPFSTRQEAMQAAFVSSKSYGMPCLQEATPQALAAALAGRPLQADDAPMPAGGLFDRNAVDQLDILDAIAATR